MTSGDRKNGVPTTVTSIPLVDPHAPKPDPSIGDLVKDATAQVSTLVRAEVELARAEITRDVKKGLTGSVFFILALVVLFYSTFFFFFFLAELLDTWLWRWVAFLIVFGIMVVTTAVLALLGYLKVRRIRGPQKTIESVKETRDALTPGGDRPEQQGDRRQRRPSDAQIRRAGNAPEPSGWRIGPARSVGRPASTVRGVISRCTPTGFGSTSWRPSPRPTTPRTGHRAAAGDPAARVRLVLVVVAPSAARPDAVPAWSPSTCAATAAATSRPAATTAGRWPATPPAWSARSATRRRRWSATPTADWSAGRRRCCIRGWCGRSRWSARRIRSRCARRR